MPCGIGLEGVSHLHGQFTGGCQHQGLWSFLPGLQTLEQRQSEGRCFAGAGLGLADKITPKHQLRKGRLLNWRWLLISLRLQCGQQRFTETETIESRFRRCFCSFNCCGEDLF